MEPIQQLREGLGFGPNLSDEDMVMLVLERYVDLTKEVTDLRRAFDLLIFAERD